MGEIADMLRGRKIIEADDSRQKLVLTTDHGDIIIVPIDQDKPLVTSSPAFIGAPKPITDVTQ